MGSVAEAAPARVELHLTGFGKFHNVPVNPTMVLVETIMEFMADRGVGLPLGASVRSCTVLETAGLGGLKVLLGLLDSKCANEEGGKTVVDSVAVLQNSMDKQRQVVWIHLGLDTGATHFKVEQQAVNEASFRCADEMGWQPTGEKIVEEDGPVWNVRETVLSTGEIVAGLGKLGFDAAVSHDAGRFVCNYVYYQSLRHAAIHSTKCLFVHVPPFTAIAEQTQLEFIVALLKVVAAISVC